jgi:phospholipase/carboxylesterase
VLLLCPQVLSGAILLRAMVPLLAAPQGDLTAKSLLIISGAQAPTDLTMARQ